MIQNKNIIKNSINHLTMGLMVFAATFGMVELPHHGDSTVNAPHQAANHVEPTGEGNSVRREREETGPHYISYGASQRTPARMGTF